MNSELAKRLEEYAESITGDILGCEMNESTHNIGMAHIGWRRLSDTLREAAAALSGEGFVCVPAEATEAMVQSVSTIVSAYAAKKIWEQMVLTSMLAAAEGGSK